MSIYHEHKLTHVDWIFESLEMRAIQRIEGTWEIDSGIEFEFDGDGVNPSITLQIVPILEDGKPRLDFVVIRHDSPIAPLSAPTTSSE